MHPALVTYLQTSIAHGKGVGPQRARELEKRGIHCYWDLLVRAPVGYATFAQPALLASLAPNTTALAHVTLTRAYQVGYAARRGGARRRFWTAEATDSSGARVTLQWFHDLKGLDERLTVDRDLYVYGEFQRRRGYLSVVHPRLWFPDRSELPDVEAYYRGFRGAAAHWYRALVADVLAALPEGDLWSERTRERYALLPLAETLRRLHKPQRADLDERYLQPLAALRRIQFDTLFGLLFALQRERARSQGRDGYPYDPPGEAYHKTVARLPYALTAAQQDALHSLIIKRGMGQRINGILQGDVGTGKTAVAGLLAAHTVENGYQVAFVAPTELLARQQFKYLQQVFRTTAVHVALLTGASTATEWAQVRRHLGSGKIAVIVGTHALFDPELKFARLGLTVVDEQHRFGVAQREALRLKDPGSDLLVMTATPIPRTLLMSLYGDLEPVTLRSGPQGRQPIRTQWLRQSQRRVALDRVSAELAAGHQVYFVYPRVEEGEDEGLLSAEAAYPKIADYFGADKVALLHGQLKDRDKDEAFVRFREGQIQVLVATSVIEVGIDVPRATVMVVQNADRFGIAQLHQIRGRVGRSELPSWCYLISDVEDNSTAAERLRALETTHDGFALAETDLKLRGPGDLFSERQSGSSAFSVWSLMRDDALVKAAAELAAEVVRTDPDLDHAGLATLKAWVERFYTRHNVFEGG